MKKVVGFILKVAAVAMAVAACVCCVIAYWDKITECFGRVREKVAEKRACCCGEYEDYADWED